MAGISLPRIGTVTNTIIRNNVIKDFDYGPIYGNGSKGQTINILSIENNIFYQNGNNNLPYYVNALTPTNNTTQNNYIANPLFVSTTNFHPQEESPAINAGLTISGLTTDYEGKTINNPPEIGAYEYGNLFKYYAYGNKPLFYKGKILI